MILLQHNVNRLCVNTNYRDDTLIIHGGRAALVKINVVFFFLSELAGGTPHTVGCNVPEKLIRSCHAGNW